MLKHSRQGAALDALRDDKDKPDPELALVGGLRLD